MEEKKTPKANLENKKLLFIEIGLCISLGIVLGAFEWGTREKQASTLEEETAVIQEEEMIPITQETPPPPPETPKIPVLHSPWQSQGIRVSRSPILRMCWHLRP